MKLMVAYFGSYGSGADLTRILYSVGINLGDEIYVEGTRSSSKLLKFSPVSLFLTRKNFLRRVSELGIELVVFPMSNPIDLYLGRVLRKKKVKCVRLIHDLRRHPGDLYPSTWIAKKILSDADGLVCLSDFIYQQIKALNQDIRVERVSHPYYVPLVEEKTDLRKPIERRILFIGRGGKYKGLSSLLAAWPKIGGPSNFLTVAGKHKRIVNQTRLKQISGWLSDLDFHKLINSHDLLVFPYMEASQSGIIPLATQYGKPVVVLPVGGLPEQVNHLSNGVIAKGSTNQDLIDAVELGLKREWDLGVVDVKKSQIDFYQSFIKAIKSNHADD
jgi:glycosyltransferase involved in cell wall biosynthesis